MRAELLLDQRLQLDPAEFVHLRVWRVVSPVRGSAHGYKYSLAHVIKGVCVLRYDNEAGKGDHRHWGTSEAPHAFTTPERLIEDFWRDVEQWRPA